MTVQLRKIKIRVSVYFAAAVTFALIFVPDGNALLSLLSCMLHEAGHLAAIRLFGGKVRSISFGAYGMRIDASHSLRISPLKEAVISLAGPCVNIILMIIGILAKSSGLFRINLCLCVFNLLPVGMTDGQSALKNVLSVIADRGKANAALKIISTAFLVVIYAVGLAVLIKTKYKFSRLAVAVYMTCISTTGNRRGESI